MNDNSWMLIRQASKMNTAGVEAFASGNNELAIHYLNGALVIVNKLLLVHCDQYDLASHLHTRQGEGTSRRNGPQSDDIAARPGSIEIPSLKDDRFYIYNQALLFSVPTHFGTSIYDNPSFSAIRTTYIEVSFFWSIVHFNMALVLHKLIHESPEKNKRYREEVILFYKLCLQNLWVIPAKSSIMNLLMLCAVNNLLHVFLDLQCNEGQAVVNLEIQAQTSICSTPLGAAAARLRALPFHKSGLEQGLLLRAIGKVVSNDQSLTEEQHKQVREMSVNHIVISALQPAYVAPGA